MVVVFLEISAYTKTMQKKSLCLCVKQTYVLFTDHYKQIFTYMSNWVKGGIQELCGTVQHIEDL